MKNKISDLRDHMFAALERLGNEELTAEELKAEIERSKAVSNLGHVIVESAKAQIMAAKFTGDIEETKKFLEEDVKKLDRPKAIYSNHSPLGIAKGDNEIKDAANG
jgi:hypothetical protein